MQDCTPIGVILVSSGSRGDKLLFRYPFELENVDENLTKGFYRNPYAVRLAEDFLTTRNNTLPTECRDSLASFSDRILANLLAVKSDLCGQKFELKIDNVAFVGYPLQLQTAPSSGSSGTSMISFNVVFVLKAGVDNLAMLSCQELSKQLAVALAHEERRCKYLGHQTGIMLQVIEENAALPEDRIEIPFKSMIHRCPLAKQLQNVYEDLRRTGVVQFRVNNWVEVSFCLPHKIHNISQQKGTRIQPEAIQKCLKSLRPYHAMLLLVDQYSILESLPLDPSPALSRLLKIASPLKSLQNLAADADLSVSQVCHLVSHLVYWAKATIIYPLCESNVYVLSPNASTLVNSTYVAEFVEEFPDLSLPVIMSEFSLPTPLAEHKDVLGLPQEQAQKIKIVVWMLKCRLLMQLHTYVFLMPASEGCLNATPRSAASSFKSDDFPVMKFQNSDRYSSVSSDDGHSLTSGLSSFTSKSPSTAEVRSDGIVVPVETHTDRNNLLMHLSEAEKKSVTDTPAASNIEDLRLFSRLSTYCNGHHHLEEIMYYENVRRSQLMTLLDKFRQVLFTCTHPDPATTYYVKM